MSERAKPGVVARPLGSAGFEEGNARGRALRALPFDPHAFKVKDELPAKLMEVDVVRTLNDLQAFDTRNTAAVVYERRIDELTAPAKE